jgi:hypothetical protein
MSDIRNYIDMYVNTEEFKHVAINGTTFLVPPTQVLYRSTQVLYRCRLLMSDGSTYFKPPAGCTWLFGIDDQYTRDHAELVTSGNASFIAGDWPGVGGADFANGKVCWRVDLDVQPLKDSLAATASKTMYAGLYMLPTGGVYTLLCHWDITMKNVAVDPE